MHIYFCGIGGAAISSLAQLAVDCGFEVSGSDRGESLGTQELQKRGIGYHLDQSGQGMARVHEQKPIDWFVHTSAVSQNHEEFQFAQKNGIKISKRDELLNFILAKFNLKMIAVAGTHGKTTTTAMLVWLFKQFEIPVSYSIGSQVSFGPSAKYEPGSEYFVYECDEFDRNFLHFSPHISLITSLNHDHADTYPTREDYCAAFRQFILQNQKMVYLYQEDMGKLEEFADLPEKESREAWHAWQEEIFGRVFVLDKQGNFKRKMNRLISLPGQHNRNNGYLAALTFFNLSYLTSTEKIKKRESDEEFREVCAHLSAFPGTYRRFEKLGENLYSDYAHHPTEIAATIQLAREIIDQKNQP